jgi:hypothetical protein
VRPGDQDGAGKQGPGTVGEAIQIRIIRAAVEISGVSSCTRNSRL